MKRNFLFTALLWLCAATAKAQDLPNPPANLQLLPKDSYVIAMDNDYQGNGTLFNLRAYGLIVYLLNNDVKLKWVIRSGKAKNETDFSVNSTRVIPANGATTNRDFKAGPFVIYNTDAAAVNLLQLVSNFNNALPAGAAPVRLFRTNADVSVDIRYDLSGFVPRAAVLTDGQNAAIHQAYFQACSVPAANYSTSINAAGLASGCYTFASEPHYDTQADGDPSVVVNNIRAFLLKGGNFLAQCHAVDSYESNTHGHFMATGYLAGTSNCNNCGNFNNTFPNADMSFAQIMGNYSMNLEGHTQEWRINGTRINNSHVITRNNANATEIGAMASKLLPANTRGGMVFYIGNHTFMNDLNSQAGVNGIRMYMNAFLTPTDPVGSIQPVFSVQCPTAANPNAALNLQTRPGLAFLYPLSVRFYVDRFPPFGEINSGDVQLSQFTLNSPGNTNTTIPVNIAYRQGYRYLATIQSSGNCQEPKVLQLFPCNSNLPVHLHSFTAVRNRLNPLQVLLQWYTETESNCAGFEIQRSADNSNWEKTGFIPSLAPGGNSTQTLQYTATDPLPANTKAFYRLKQMDLDGNSTYTTVVTVAGTGNRSSIQVYPNPAVNGTVTIELDKPVPGMQVKVADMNGRIIRELNNCTERIIRLSGLGSGIYILNLSSPQDGVLMHHKIIAGN